MPTVKSTKACGVMIWHKVMVFTHDLMVIDIWDLGKMIYNMERVLKFGLMILDMKVFIKMDKIMEKENYHGEMAVRITDNF